MSIPYPQTRPSWAVQSVVALAYAGLGSLLTTPDEPKPGCFAFFGVPFVGIRINEVGWRGRSRRFASGLFRGCALIAWTYVNSVETNGVSDSGDVEVNPMSYDIGLSNTESVNRSSRQSLSAVTRRW
ncbi:hypothetical protein BN2476_630132 [Paraburkholderia piptadeniae]|uniref:Uncharacterized protein n=1 Tax=Paraburkholderia piptadeniae TaxID=1701573 RepID=A0A1N7SLS7_9BURK|nr:hypothetical protein BN2476_630132 [Paraburkholderia piptadeniae]